MSATVTARASAERVVEMKAKDASPHLTVGDLAKFLDACRAAGVEDDVPFQVMSAGAGTTARCLRAACRELLDEPHAGLVAAFVIPPLHPVEAEVLS